MSQFKEVNKEIVTKLDTLTNSFKEIQMRNEELADEVASLKAERKKDHLRMMQLEDQIKQNNLIFKGLNANSDMKEAASEVCRYILQLSVPPVILSTKILFERNGKVTAVIKLDSDEMVEAILKNTNKLSGTNIYIERDLNCDKQHNKKAMLQLKKSIQQISSQHRIMVREDCIKIQDKWLKWDSDKQLTCDKQGATTFLKNLFGDKYQQIQLNYYALLEKANSKK